MPLGALGFRALSFLWHNSSKVSGLVDSGWFCSRFWLAWYGLRAGWPAFCGPGGGVFSRRLYSGKYSWPDHCRRIRSGRLEPGTAGCSPNWRCRSSAAAKSPMSFDRNSAGSPRCLGWRGSLDGLRFRFGARFGSCFGSIRAGPLAGPPFFNLARCRTGPLRCCTWAYLDGRHPITSPRFDPAPS